MSDTRTASHLEAEDTFDVDDTFVVPSLAAFVPPGGREETATARLTSTYHDTGDQRLLRSRVTLRRRDGDDDQGWQLKVPEGTARLEIRRPLGDDVAEDVPAVLGTAVAGLVDGRPLHPVAVVTTVRVRHRVLDADGALVVEVDDDLVAGGSSFVDGVRMWREVEVELGSGSRALLAEVGAALVTAGARPAPGASKLGRTVGLAPGPVLGRGAAAVHAYLVEQVDALVASDVALRRGKDPVHSTRVATRRFRSVLRVFAGLVEAAEAERIDGELRWWAGVLGEARDAQVQRERHRAAVAALPSELVLGPVLARLDQDTTGAEARARERIAAEMDGERYRALLQDLRRWREDPPFAVAGAGRGVVRRAVARAGDRADRRLRRAVRGDDDELLHGARKAAKRARYAHELLRAGGAERDRRPAKQGVKRYKQIQQVLGEHQDAVVAARLVRRLGAAAGGRGENGFTFGVLWQREQQAADVARERVRALR